MYLKQTRKKRQKQQWQFLSKQVKKLVEQNKFEQLASQQKQYLIGRLRSLFGQLSRWQQASKLRKALGAAALLLGLSASGVQAQSFAPVAHNPFGLTHNEEFNYSTLADLDGDGDLDLISVHYDSETEEQSFAFFENQSADEGSTPNFVAAVTDYAGLALPDQDNTEYTNPEFADLDNDGDLDLIIGGYRDVEDNYESQFYYFENTGSADAPAFGERMIDPFSLDGGDSDTTTPHLADIDGDGDLDMFSVSAVYDYETEENNIQLLFIENTGSATSPSFAAPSNTVFGISPESFSGLISFDLADIDNDGDLDLMAGSFLNEDNPLTGINFSYFENTGSSSNPQFAAPAENPFDLSTQLGAFIWPILGDLDNDGDIDILSEGIFSPALESSVWAYFENQLDPSALQEASLNAQAKLFPNVTSGLAQLELEAEEVQDAFQLSIFDGNGKLVRQNTLAGGRFVSESIDLSAFATGMYYVQIRTTEGVLVRQLIKQ